MGTGTGLRPVPGPSVARAGRVAPGPLRLRADSLPSTGMCRAALAATLLLFALAVAVPAASPPAAAADEATPHCASGGGRPPREGNVPTPEWDQDCDAVRDEVDNCPPLKPDDFANRNPDQRDTDGDGRGDKCDDDDDGDEIPDGADGCSTEPGPGPCTPKDWDGDGHNDSADNCVPRFDGDASMHNPGQADSDSDGVGDVCDNDDDEDYVPDWTDNCPVEPNQNQTDVDGDGRGAACDADDGAGASGGPGTGPGASSDKTKPGLRLTVAGRHRLRAVEAGLVVKLRCSEACAATATLIADRRTARKLGLPRSRVAGEGVAEVARAATTYAFVRLPAKVKRRVWKRPVTRLTLRVEAVDRAGNRRAVARRLTLVR